MSLEIIPIRFDVQVDENTDLARIIADGIRLQDGDVVVVSQKVVSKREGRTVDLRSVTPSLLAEGISSEYGKDPRIVEMILRESKRIVRMGRGGVMIVETHHGFVCANAGIDESNVGPGRVTLLPADPDASAGELRRRLAGMTGRSVAVLVSDTFGRPFRAGQTDCAVGVSGIGAILDYRGTRDSLGRELRVSEIAVADEICAAAELAKGKADNRPVSVVRNLRFPASGASVNALLRPEDEDLFR